MRRTILIGALALNGLASSIVLAETTAPAKSERAMSPDSAKAGASPSEKSERAMSPDAGKAGASPSPKSERAMDPEKSEK